MLFGLDTFLVLLLVQTSWSKNDGLKPMNLTTPERCIQEASTLETLSEKDLSAFLFRKKERGEFWDRPVKHIRSPLVVGVQLAIRSLIDIDERRQLVKLNGFFSFFWQDEIHIWNETWPFMCIEYLIVPHGDTTGLWVPEIAVMNADLKYIVTRGKGDLVRLYSDGRAMFAPGGTLEFYCEFDLSMFPFDRQVCHINMESWRYTTRYQVFSDPDVVPINTTKHEQWEIIGTGFGAGEVSYPNGNAFSTIRFDLMLKRKHGYYLLTVILPCLLVAAIEIVTFTMPHNKGIRLEVSFTCLLAFSVFQTMVVADLPKSADHPPLLLILISLLTVYISIAIFFQSICMYLSGRAHDAKFFPPLFIFQLANAAAPLVRIPKLGLPAKPAKIPGKEERDSKINSSRVNRRAWHFVALVTDRCACFIFLTLLTLSSIGLLLVVPAVF